MSDKREVPSRDSIEEQYKWDLSKMFEDVGSWEKDFAEVEKRYYHFLDFRGKLS